MNLLQLWNFESDGRIEVYDFALLQQTASGFPIFGSDKIRWLWNTILQIPRTLAVQKVTWKCRKDFTMILHLSWQEFKPCSAVVLRRRFMEVFFPNFPKTGHFQGFLLPDWTLIIKKRLACCFVFTGIRFVSSSWFLDFRLTNSLYQ